MQLHVEIPAACNCKLAATLMCTACSLQSYWLVYWSEDKLNLSETDDPTSFYIRTYNLIGLSGAWSRPV